MKKIDIVGIAFGNFRRRKTRSILTVLGVVIGVASIVVMVSLGIGVNVYFDQQTASMGDLTTIRVNPARDPETGQQTGSLDDELVELLEGVDKVTMVSPEIEFYGKFGSGKYYSSANIVGVRSEYLDELGFKAEQGVIEYLGPVDKKNIKCLIGSEIPYQFYNPRDRNNNMGGMMMGGMGGMDDGTERPPPPVDLMSEDAKLKFTFDWSYGEKKQPGFGDQTVKKPKLFNMMPTAILKPSDWSKDGSIFVDIETAKFLKKEEEKSQDSQMGGTIMISGSGGSSSSRDKDSYDNIKVITASIEDTAEVTDVLKNEYGLEAYSSGEYISSMKNITKVLQLVLGGIGGISLLVAAIGITNTMIMSIYERTKEIGVMKVIGCQLKDIRTMFLCEAGFIGLFGGAVGLIISYSISFLLNFVTKGGGDMMGGMLGGMLGGMMSGDAEVKLSIIPPWLALVAVVFAIFVSLLSGFLPARRAMKLSALEAMKT